MRGSRKFSRGMGGGGGGGAVQIPRSGLTDMAKINNLAIRWTEKKSQEKVTEKKSQEIKSQEKRS